MVWLDVVWCGMVWYGMVFVWNGMVWYGMVWYGTVSQGRADYTTGLEVFQHATRLLTDRRDVLQPEHLTARAPFCRRLLG